MTLRGTPAPGVRSINGILGANQDISISSSNGSVSVVANEATRSIDIRTTGLNPGTAIENVPCDANVYVGAAVRMEISGTAVLAQANSVENANVLGFVEEKTGNICKVRFQGLTDSVFSGLDVTKEYFLSDVTPGAITTTPPINAGTVVLKVGQPFSNQQFVVFKGQRMIRS